jgi:hypothetical protein
MEDRVVAERNAALAEGDGTVVDGEGAAAKKDKTAGKVGEAAAESKTTKFSELFLYPASVALGAAIFLALFFRPPERAQQQAAVAGATPH